MLIRSFSILVFFVVPFVTHAASSEFELTCRSKAKELAAETYRNCVTEARNSQVEEIKKEWADDLKSLKAKYEKRIAKISKKSNKQSRAQSRTESGANSSHALKNIDTSESTPPQDSSADESTMDIPEPIDDQKNL